MSQYIQGVVDYIPMIQPFQPDFNLFTKVLETKDAQYKAGYDKLSSLYGTLLNSPMSREDNIELRNKFFNDISSQIQKISSLDLSKSQNVEAAYKVFQPLIDNDYILKDMSYTKTAYDEMQRGESLRNCTDPKKCPGQYWDGGARLIQYNIEDFKKARREDTLRMRNPRFVPKVNLSKQAMDYAKEMGFKITIPDFTPDGRYMVHTTNGPNMIPGLADTFMSVFGDDPAAADYYSALSELNRNDFSHDESNIQKYGSQEAAEMYYLDDTHRRVVEASAAQLEAARKQEAQASNKKAVIDGMIKTKGVDPNDPDDQDLVKDRYQTMVDQMISGANAETHETDLNTVASDDFATLDLDSKRARIDNVAARTLMQGDLYQAANDYAMQTMDVKMEVNQYKLKEYDHMLSMARMSAQHAYDKAMDDYRTANQAELYKHNKSIDLMADLFPNGKKNGATPDGRDPNNRGWLGVGVGKGGTVLDPNLKGSDAKKVVTATDNAKSVASDIIVKGYYELKTIMDNEKDPQAKAFYKAKLEELFGTGATKVENITRDPYDTYGGVPDNLIDLAKLGWDLLFGDTEETKVVNTGGYLDENGSLLYGAFGKAGQSFDQNPEFNKPGSPNSWEKTAERVANFFKNDTVGKRLVKPSVNPETGLNQYGVLGAIDTYQTTAKRNYDNYIKAQATNNKIVHEAVIGGDASIPVLNQLSTYPSAPGNPNMSITERIYGIDAPDAIREHTKTSLGRMVMNGSVMSLPEFKRIYADSPEARQVAERVVQETYNTRPGQQGGFNRKSYEDAVNIVLETLSDDAEDVYTEYMDQFTYIYNQSEKAAVKDLDKRKNEQGEGFIPLSNFYMFNDAGSGVQANTVMTTVDPAYPGDMQVYDFVDFYEKIVLPYKDKDDAGISVYQGLGGDLTERGFFRDDADPTDDNEGAFTTLQALRMELNETRDIEDKTRGVFDMYMHPIIRNNQNEIAISFSVSPQYTDNHTGSSKAMKFMNKSGREFTIVIDKNKVPEAEQLEMVRRLDQGPYTVAMRADKKIDLTDYPLGGELTILPTTNDSYVATGSVVDHMDPDSFLPVKTSYTSFMGPDDNLENFSQRHQEMLARLHGSVAYAQEQIRAINPNIIKDPKAFDNQ